MKAPTPLCSSNSTAESALDFRGATITSDAGLLACRELDAALGLTETANDYIHESRTGRNVQHPLLPLLRQSVYSRLAGYEDTNDAERLAQDPAMRVIVGWQGTDKQAASTNTMSRFETNRRGEPGRAGDSPAGDSSESPVHGQQEGVAYNGHFESVCYHPLFLFNHFGDCEGAMLRPGNVHSAERWREVLEPVVKRYQEKESGCCSGPMLPLPSPRCTSTWSQGTLATLCGFRPTRYYKETSSTY